MKEQSQELAPEFQTKPLTTERVENILSHLKSAPSGIRMSSDKDYKFEVKEVSHEDSSVDGFLIRCGFWRPDTLTGEMGEGFGRWNHVPRNGSVKSVVLTAYVAIKLVVEHEMMESFEFMNTKVLDPHKNLPSLAYPNFLPNELLNL